MTYNVFGGTLNLAQSQSQLQNITELTRRFIRVSQGSPQATIDAT